MPDFIEKLETAQSQTQSDVGLFLAPHIEKIPLPVQRHDEPFLPLGKAVIQATTDITCAYIFDMAAYLTLGAVGIIALERTIDYVSRDRITILHGQFTGTDYQNLWDENAFGVDAITLAPTQPTEDFINRKDRAVFTCSDQNSELAITDNIGLFSLTDNRMSIGQRKRKYSIQLPDRNLLTSKLRADFTDQIRKSIETLKHDST